MDAEHNLRALLGNIFSNIKAGHYQTGQFCEAVKLACEMNEVTDCDLQDPMPTARDEAGNVTMTKSCPTCTYRDTSILDNPCANCCNGEAWYPLEPDNAITAETKDHARGQGPWRYVDKGRKCTHCITRIDSEGNMVDLIRANNRVYESDLNGYRPNYCPDCGHPIEETEAV